jgi:Secretion system C-terminal sorting domain
MRLPIYATLLSYTFCSTHLGHAQTFGWSRHLAGPAEEIYDDMALAPNGDVLLVGYFYETVDFDPGTGEVNLSAQGFEDAFIQRLTSTGELVWAKRIGGSLSDKAVGVAADGQGNIWVTGAFQGTVDLDPGTGTQNFNSVAGSSDPFLLKLDESGEFLWAGKVGGPEFDEPADLGVAANGDAYVCGFFSEGMDIDPGTAVQVEQSAGGQDIFLFKVNNAGALQWGVAMGGADGDLGLGLAVDGPGNVYVTGSYSDGADLDPGTGVLELSSEGGWDILTMKLNAQGVTQWAKGVGGPENFDNGYSIAVDAEGNVITTGSFFTTIDLDPGPGQFNVVPSNDFTDDVFVQKLDLDGNFLWGGALVGPGAGLGYSVALEPTGGVVLSGYFFGSFDLDPDPLGTFILTPDCPTDFAGTYFARLSSEGDFVSGGQFAGAATLQAHNSVCDTDGNLYFAGHVERAESDPGYEYDMDPGSGEFPLVAEAFRDGYVLKLNATTSGVAPVAAATGVALAPNPARNEVAITVPAELRDASYVVLDATGRSVLAGAIGQPRTTLATSSLSAGTYTVRVDALGKTVHSQKLVLLR